MLGAPVPPIQSGQGTSRPQEIIGNPDHGWIGARRSVSKRWPRCLQLQSPRSFLGAPPISHGTEGPSDPSSLGALRMEATRVSDPRCRDVTRSLKRVDVARRAHQSGGSGGRRWSSPPPQSLIYSCGECEKAALVRMNCWNCNQIIEVLLYSHLKAFQVFHQSLCT